MDIKNMFYDDINREINGVIKVDQAAEEVIESEVTEYVITRELKKHFQSFFEAFNNSYNRPTSDIGVWISGFFGSGKSHFLKILSYILENKEINGKTTVERFEEKLQENPEIYELIDKTSLYPIDTILFNIDIEGPMEKDKTAVLKVFAKMFYKHRGYYGDDLKIAKLEEYIDRKGKLEEFKSIFEEKSGETWEDSRDVFYFYEEVITESISELLDISEESAQKWLDANEKVDISISELVSEIKTYVDNKPEDYRLVFMIDEVGQYVGSDTDMLLNLQSIVEKLGSECMGKVWVVATGQEALDEIIRARSDEFSRIQARFKTRLSLSSSSADEVIQKRILKKNDEAIDVLTRVYEKEENVMDNLFKFRGAIGDIRGYKNSEEFYINFPFVPYQYILMQKIYREIRRHGNVGKHLSGGERSMLSGFQEAAQKIQDKDEYSLVPFWRFYDAVHSFLDSTIRAVTERAERAAASGEGLEEFDLGVLKLLYMIRYIDDVPANLDNITIMMADDIKIDKIGERNKIQKSLDRLLQQNYIARSGEVYNFLTDEEQDVEREIKDEFVDPSEITKQIAEIIFERIYPYKKLRYQKKYDFDFDKKVDGINYGNPSGAMELEILSIATDKMDKQELTLRTMSSNKAIVVLDETNYYEFLENTLKIEKYARKKNFSQLPKSMQDIIRGKQEDAEGYKKDALDELEDSFIEAKYYVNGDIISPKGATPKAKIDETLESLVGSIYSKLDYVDKHAETDEDIIYILNNKNIETNMEGFDPNAKALQEVETYLEYRNEQHLPTNMADVQKRFKETPYGWREIDIAYVVADLIANGKVTIIYAGESVKADDARMPDLLRRRSEIGRTKIKKREMIKTSKIKSTREFLRDFFDMMDVPEDDDGLVNFIIEKFTELEEHYDRLLSKYQFKNYPDEGKVILAKKTIKELLRAKGDNIALVDKILGMEDDIYDMQEDMEDVEEFFKTQVRIFDEAFRLVENLRQDLDDINKNERARDALNELRRIVYSNPRENKFDYRDIPKLAPLMDTVREEHDKMLEAEREKLFENIVECRKAISEVANSDDPNMLEINEGSGKYFNYPSIKKIFDGAGRYYDKKIEEIKEENSTTVLKGMAQSIFETKDSAIKDIVKILDTLINPQKPEPEPKPEPKPVEPTPVKPKKIKRLDRRGVFTATTLKSEEEINKYVRDIKNNLIKYLEDCDEVEIN